MITLADIQQAHSRIAPQILRTPTLHSDALSKATGASVTLKLENLQAIGSFKERGAANRLALLTPPERAAGVIAMSAGNHAQAVARHAALLGVAATIVMPTTTPSTKVSRTRAWGATVILHGDNLQHSAAHAHQLAAAHNLVFVHPYDDEAVIAGQGTLALELMADAPGTEILVIPVGGGGLIAGCALAAKSLNPAIQVIGVEVAGYPALRQTLDGLPIQTGGPTIAEGIAVHQIGAHCLPLIKAHVDDVLIVPERVVEDAIALLAEGAKQVAEGAGATGIAALLAHPERFRAKRVGTPICGGNIDGRILANVLLRGLLRDGRLLRLTMDIPDRPGVLADIAGLIGTSGGNIIEVVHQRLFDAPSVQAAELELMIEARDPMHANQIVLALEDRYVVKRT